MFVILTEPSGKVQQIEVRSVVVYDHDGTPLSVTAQIAPTAAAVAHVADKDFRETLSALGIDKLVIVKNVEVGHGPSV